MSVIYASLNETDIDAGDKALGKMKQDARWMRVDTRDALNEGDAAATGTVVLFVRSVLEERC